MSMYNNYMVVVLPKLTEPVVVISTEEYLEVWNKYGIFEMKEDQLSVVEHYFKVSEGKPLVFLPEDNIPKYQAKLKSLIVKAESRELN